MQEVRIYVFQQSFHDISFVNIFSFQVERMMVQLETGDILLGMLTYSPTRGRKGKVLNIIFPF